MYTRCRKRNEREGERERHGEAPLIGRWHRGTLQLSWGYMNPDIYASLSAISSLASLSRSLFLSLSHTISLPLIRLAFTLATILPCSETQARHMDPGTINTRFPNQRPSLSRSLSFIISLLFYLSLTHFLCPVLCFCFILFLHLSRFHIYSIRQPLRHRG